MKFSVIHPTARVKPTGSFNGGWCEACEQWFNQCDNAADGEYLLIVHESRISSFWDYFDSCVGGSGFTFPKWGRFTLIINHNRDCVVDQVNEGLKAATGEIIIGTMDDLFAPQGWDTKLAAFVPDTSQPVALHCLTGSQRDNQIFNPACYTRALLDITGPICPEYESMFVDDEFTAKVTQLGIVVETGLKFEHRHPIFKTAKMDEVYAAQNRREAYEQGLRVFQKRAALGFPRVEIPGWPKPSSVSHPVNLPAPRRIAFCLPGESFRFEWLRGVMELFNTLGNANWQVNLCFGYTTSPYHTRINLTNDVLNRAAADFKPEYVFWLDDDNLIKPEDFMRLVAFLDQQPEADAISGWCWIRQKTRWGISCGMFSEDTQVHMKLFELPELFAEGGKPRRMEVGGFPAILMKYEVLEKLGAGAFQPVTKADLPELLGDLPRISEPTDEWFSGEDISFFLHARKAGLKIWVDPACKVAHLKFISQEPDIQLFRDTPEALKQWREQVNGKAIPAPANYEEVIVP